MLEDSPIGRLLNEGVACDRPNSDNSSTNRTARITPTECLCFAVAKHLPSVALSFAATNLWNAEKRQKTGKVRGC